MIEFSTKFLICQNLLHEQENSLQNFKLPEPVVCIGGILKIELLGRVQRQEMDDLFYIWFVQPTHLQQSYFGVDIYHAAPPT